MDFEDLDSLFLSLSKPAFSSELRKTSEDSSSGFEGITQTRPSNPSHFKTLHPFVVALIHYPYVIPIGVGLTLRLINGET